MFPWFQLSTHGFRISVRNVVISAIKKSKYLQSESLDPGFTASNQVVKEVGLAPTDAVTPTAAYDKPATLPLPNTQTPTLPSSET